MFLVFVIAWGLASYFQFRDGVTAANDRLDEKVRQALDEQHGDASNILLLGTDHARLAGRESANRTDSITLVRVDSSRAPHRLPLDSARPARRDPRVRHVEGQRGDAARRCRAGRATVKQLTGCRSTTS